jgi:glycosyltransferase involved in cell wall biosynthesis
VIRVEPISELIVFSHLRWDWVWQRPQHLISRIGRDRPTWFVEEPQVRSDLDRPSFATNCTDDGVIRAWLNVRGEGWLGFGDQVDDQYAEHLAELLPPRQGRVAWLYTALALHLAERLHPDVIVYDVMDDLAAFKGAAPEHRLRHHAALRRADAVFTGGRSLHHSVLAARTANVHCFPSGVETEHYAHAVAARPPHRPRPVAGYVGVIDERLDLELLAGLADALPDWDLQVVGPVAKISPAALPRRPNLHYPGPVPYADLPTVMTGFDVALMPFALNQATRSISPTKTLEYFAAGLPVISTRVPDVVAEYDALVHLADDAEAFAAACRSARGSNRIEHLQRVRPLLDRQHWDAIAARMTTIVGAIASRAEPEIDEEATGSA